MKNTSKQEPGQLLLREIEQLEQRLASHEAAMTGYFSEMARISSALEEEQSRKAGLEHELACLRQQLDTERKSTRNASLRKKVQNLFRWLDKGQAKGG